MMLYNSILNNEKYLEVVRQIENLKFITNGKWDWEHGLGHYKRVAEYVRKILLQLNADNRTIELGMIAALLHDIGLSQSGTDKIDHDIKSSEMFLDYVSGITKEEEEIIKHAIADHSKGNNINSIIGLALILGDKLDVTYHRTENSSIQDEINTEIQKIRNVDIVINDKELIVKYTTIGEFNLKILMNWEKAITIPNKIAKYLNKEYKFFINDTEINFYELIDEKSSYNI